MSTLCRAVPTMGGRCLEAAVAYARMLTEAGFPLTLVVPDGEGTPDRVVLMWSDDEDPEESFDPDEREAAPAGRIVLEHYARTLALLSTSEAVAGAWLERQT